MSELSNSNSIAKPIRLGPLTLTFAGVVVLAVGFVCADWYRAVPLDTQPTFVGRNACVDCHQAQHRSWHHSHHDLAMDIANDETVLGDFDNVTFEHFGIPSRMFRDGSRYMIHTEGPDGKMTDFEITYVFGCDPIQQYMVEFDRPENMPNHEIARLQVLRISWDTNLNKWFYIPPPDVDEKLDPSDPLHWTKSGQNWNHMCADCHSTNLRKNYDIKTQTYHTTFSDIDVSCESCHGPGSIHVQLANSRSLFWDRNFGYGLRKIKGQSHQVEVESCAPCHSRRRVLHPESGLSTDYFNCCSNSVLRPETYYPDGQIKDEVYVYGSFIQSKMFHKGIRCTDCHDPHSLKLKHEGNALCTSCHQHTPAKYDAPGHHHHPLASTGASCVECHMPETPYMEIDLRRDHSLRVPRPDLSVKFKTPNACTGCHLEKKNIDPSKHASLRYYVDWLNARDSDEQIDAEIARVDRWAEGWINQWYDDKPRPDHFANVLAPAWNGDPNSNVSLSNLAKSRSQPAIIRASALLQLSQNPGRDAISAAIRGIKDKDPQVRAVSIGVFEWNPAQNRNDLLLEHVQPLLNDDMRVVRIEAARVLASVPYNSFKPEYKERLKSGVSEYREGLLAHSDQAATHMSLALLDESLARATENRDDQLGWLRSAISNYRNAILVQPDVTGPRSNLAAILEQLHEMDEVQQLRSQELKLLARDAQLAPQVAAVQYRYASALQTSGQTEEAIQRYKLAAKLEPNVGQYQYALAIVLHHQGKIDDAVKAIRRATQLEPSRSDFRFALALYLVDAKKFDEARPIVEALLKLMPRDQNLIALYARIRSSSVD